MGCNSQCGSVQTICIIVILSSMVWESRQSEIPWDKWSWTMQVPIEDAEQNFRRNQNIPTKAPSFVCECPPHKECVIDFKVNKDMVYFLNMRGIIRNKELKVVKEDIKKIEHSGGVYEAAKDKMEVIRNRRSNLNSERKNCCCPPTNVYMPSFITDHKFGKLLDTFKKDKTM